MTPAEITAMLGLRLPDRDPVRRRLARCHDIGDLRAVAAARTPRAVFDYVDGGADQESTLRRNEQAFRRAEFTARNLVDVSAVSTSGELLGRSISFPLVLAPTGYSRIMHPAGELAVARAARSAGIPYTLSTVGSTSIEDVAATGHPDPWFQLYMWRDRGFVAELLRRAEATGYGTLVVSIDVPVSGHRLRDSHNGLTIPPRLTPRAIAGIARHFTYWTGMVRAPAVTFASAPPGLGGAGATVQSIGAQFDPSLSWDDITWVRERWGRTLVVKGPLSPAESVRARSAGADGVQLSNHGGRQLDRLAPPIFGVRAVRDAVGPEALVLVDSGVRHGMDIAVAVAQGADAAAAGRAYLYGLMAAGERGVEHALTILDAEFRRTMQLLGVRTVDELRTAGPELVRLQARRTAT